MNTQGVSGNYSVLAAAQNLANLRKNWIKKVDVNGDGKIDAEELAKAQTIRERDAVATIKEYDIDGDGSLNATEADALAKANQMAALQDVVGKLIDKEDSEGIKKLLVLLDKKGNSSELPILLKTNSAVEGSNDEQEVISDLTSILGDDYYNQLKDAFTNELGISDDEGLSSTLDITV